jgi:hypothetical protein
MCVLGTDCKSSCKSKYHMITATTVLNVICNTSSVICLNLYVGMFRHYVVLRRCDCWWHLKASRITELTASSFYKYTHNPCKWTLHNSFYSTNHRWRITNDIKDRRGCDHMVFGFTTAFAISAYHYCSFRQQSKTHKQHTIPINIYI